MKIKYILVLMIFSLLSCGDEFESLNVDPNRPTVAPADALFASAVKGAARLNSHASVNLNVTRLYAQYWAQTTYPDESQFNQTSRRIPQNLWDNSYLQLNDLKAAKEGIINGSYASNEQQLQANQENQVEIMMVYIYSQLVDLFGNVPYSEALNPDNTRPAYDDAATIYQDLIDRLTAAVNAMDAGAGGIAGSQDYLFDGDVAGWMKFANSLKLRLAMRLSDVNPGLSKSAAESAASMIISSNAEAAKYNFIDGSPNSNPVWESLVQSGRNDYVIANTTAEYLNSMNDPRRGVLMTETDDGYVGGIYGDANAYSSFSHLSAMFEDPALDGTLMNYAEVCFLMAEASWLGYSVPGSAAEWYNMGVMASMDEFGVSSADAQAYLAAHPWDDNPETLAYEKWVSQFDNGIQGWSVWREFDYPTLKAPPGMSVSDIPTRFLYPNNEGQLNGANYDAAGAAIGGDTKTTKLFWDVN